MPGQGRLGDKSQATVDAHGCPACPHPANGPAVQGSPDVLVNFRPALPAYSGLGTVLIHGIEGYG